MDMRPIWCLEFDGSAPMKVIFRMHAWLSRMQSPQFRRRMKRKLVRYLARLHDKTAVLRDMHRGR